jgi:dTDP-4-dehydrorhamnose 3,5-epimerase
MGNIILFAPRRFGDERGWFSEVFNARREIGNGIAVDFVQDNQSYSTLSGTIRGIHFQRPPHAQAKLVRCSRGRLIDYAVDLRRGSPTYGHYVAAELTADKGEQLFVPVGFGHAFITLEPGTEICYKVSDYYDADCDGGLRWDSPEIAIDWPNVATVTLSERDRTLPTLVDFQSPFAYDGVPMKMINLG